MNGGEGKEVGIRLLSKVTLFDYNVSTMLRGAQAEMSFTQAL